MRSMGVLLRLLISPVLLFGTLVFEVLLAMAIYIYLATNHIETFGEMVRIARNILNVLVDTMETWLPAISNQAYATLVGEIGPKSFLLLVLGLFASGLLRLVIWVCKGAVRTVRQFAGG